MLEIDKKLISLDIFEKKFVCDLSACKGACCVEGDAGAPLTMEEVNILEENLEKIKPFMRQEGIEATEKEGVFYMDYDNAPVTTLVNGKECAFVRFDEKGTALCSIEDAYNNGKIDFKKPISCHLYPIRVAKLREYEAVNYNEWDICKPACDCGAKLDVEVYRFLKEPIIRKWGKTFYEQLEVAAKELKNN
ncbi:DUF3109 family protein [Parvicella tangerina]|uniref:DUF3109 family protein n=1 Tax=Parvicella tangerina TaxID=2829795 RepID=A0A916JPK2_9FLAO|nr:DUF3109 family protein [Parvicella tangerina]CAG5086353.1 hypothetical protein CRYO30217_03092 [Parvicella tangerina]